jgi:hypothetical protein
MSEIVNLRRARKAKRRAEMGTQAEANGVEHSVSKRVRDRAKAQNEKQRHVIEAHRLKDRDA